MRLHPRKYILEFVISACIIGAAGAAVFIYVSHTAKDMGASYTESADETGNPEKGFYELMYFSEGTEPQEVSADLLAMRIGIGEFSGRYQEKISDEADSDSENDAYIPLSDEFIGSLSIQLSLCRETKTPVILRFAYDDFNGWPDCEPDMDHIVSHIGQLQEVFYEYEDVICCVESGILGPFGEQHTSQMVTQENINTLLDALLEAVPDTIPVSVRRPSYYAGYVGITETALQDYRAEEGSDFYRIGIYNDGYLGTFSDFNTFEDRNVFNEWMSYQGGHTLYGSEATVSDDPDYLDWTYVDHVCEEMFLTHTSYLNRYFNSRVLDRWKDTQYQGDDKIYAGKTVYDYVENHLGYRYVLRKAEYTGLASRHKVTFEIENVGAGNTIRQRQVSVFAVDENGQAEEFPQVYDVRNWESREKVCETAELDLSGLHGKCRIYLKITDELGNTVRFSNENNEFSEEYGNFCGEIS